MIHAENVFKDSFTIWQSIIERWYYRIREHGKMREAGGIDVGGIDVSIICTVTLILTSKTREPLCRPPPPSLRHKNNISPPSSPLNLQINQPRSHAQSFFKAKSYLQINQPPSIARPIIF